MCLFKNILDLCDHPECDIVMSIYNSSYLEKPKQNMANRSSARLQTMSSLSSREAPFKPVTLSSMHHIVEERDNYQENQRLKQPNKNLMKQEKQFDSEQISEVEELRKQLEILRNNQALMMQQIEIMNQQMSRIIELSSV